MSLITTLALAATTSASTAALPQCGWDKPGVNPFMGDVVAAVDRYADIPVETRAKLKARLQAREYDDIAVIRRDAIKGKADYKPEIRDMHFGEGSVCRTVTRAKWTPSMEELGLVYCEADHCILVPTVCRNVSRVTRLTSPLDPAPAAGGPALTPGSAPDYSVASAAPSQAPLTFDAPAAGPLASAAPGSFAQMAGIPAVVAPGLDGNTARPFGGAGGENAFGGPGGLGGLGGLGGVGGTAALPVFFGGPATATGPEVPSGVTLAIPEPSTWALLTLGLLAVLRRACIKR